MKHVLDIIYIFALYLGVFGINICAFHYHETLIFLVFVLTVTSEYSYIFTYRNLHDVNTQKSSLVCFI